MLPRPSRSRAAPDPALVCPDTLFRRTITLIARLELATSAVHEDTGSVTCVTELQEWVARGPGLW